MYWAYIFISRYIHTFSNIVKIHPLKSEMFVIAGNVRLDSSINEEEENSFNLTQVYLLCILITNYINS